MLWLASRKACWDGPLNVEDDDSIPIGIRLSGVRAQSREVDLVGDDSETRGEFKLDESFGSVASMGRTLRLTSWTLGDFLTPLAFSNFTGSQLIDLCLP